MGHRVSEGLQLLVGRFEFRGAPVQIGVELSDFVLFPSTLADVADRAHA